MGRMVLRRLAALPLALLGVSALIFLVIHALPGDPARMMAGPEATQEAVDAMRGRLGIDRPLLVQYGHFVVDAVRGDFGVSLKSQKPVAQEIGQRVPFTLSLALVSYAGAILVGVPAGMVAANSTRGWSSSGTRASRPWAMLMRSSTCSRAGKR